MATTEATRKSAPATSKKANGATSKAISKSAVPEEDVPVIDDDDKSDGTADPTLEKLREDEDALEVLEPKAEPRRWIIGKPPEAGGDESTYSIYVQKPLSYMARWRFFSLVSRTIAEALKQGGTVDFGMGGALDPDDDLPMADRIRRLREQDFSSAGNFMQLAMNLISYSPGFLLECYCLWLDVPAKEKRWAKEVMSQNHDPDNDKWGLTDDDGIEMIEIFIDQNYEDIRSFFAEKLPQIVKRVQQREEGRQGRASASVPSKQ